MSKTNAEFTVTEKPKNMDIFRFYQFKKPFTPVPSLLTNNQTNDHQQFGQVIATTKVEKENLNPILPDPAGFPTNVNNLPKPKATTSTTQQGGLNASYSYEGVLKKFYSLEAQNAAYARISNLKAKRRAQRQALVAERSFQLIFN